MLGKIRRGLTAWAVPRFLGYGPERLLAALQGLGLGRGDVLMLHSALNPHNGFSGTPRELIDVLKQLVGEAGLLVMPSLPYRDSSRAFLERGQPMKVRRTPSHMGLLTEVFRRGKDVQRSLSPTHPLLAWGERAEEFIAGHERALSPFGADSPFERLLQWQAKFLCFDTHFDTITFSHYLEDRFQDQLPVPLYDPEPLTGLVIDAQGREHRVPTLVISDIARHCRRDEWLYRAALADGILRRRRLGNTRLLVVSATDFCATTRSLLERGESFFVTPDGCTG